LNYLPEEEAQLLLSKPRDRFVMPLTDNIDIPEEDPEMYNRGMYRLKDVLPEFIKKLSPQQQLVLALRFGLGDLPEQTMEYIGKILGRTREYVRQIEEKAVRNLRQKLLESGILDEDEHARLSKIPHQKCSYMLNSTTPSKATRPDETPVPHGVKHVSSKTLGQKLCHMKGRLYG
jgi:hypothetical protein